jgi:hypothetical protein
MSPPDESRPPRGTGLETDVVTTVEGILTPAADSRRPSRRASVHTSHGAAPSDSPAVVAQAVAAILAATTEPEESDLPTALREVVRTRHAARLILGSQLRPAEQRALLGSLARRTSQAELASWGLAAIALELQPGADVAAVLERCERALGSSR